MAAGEPPWFPSAFPPDTARLPVDRGRGVRRTRLCALAIRGPKGRELILREAPEDP